MPSRKKLKKVKRKKHFSKSKNFLFLLPALFLVFVILFVSSPRNTTQYAQTSTTSVSIVDFQFSPATVTVPVGGTVTWTNQSQGGHQHTTTSNIAGTPTSWDSGLTNPGGTFSKTFTTAGTYSYHCNVHTFMTGTVIVTATGITPTPTFTPAPTFVCMGLGTCPTSPSPSPNFTGPPTQTTITPMVTPSVTNIPTISPMPTDTPVATQSAGGDHKKTDSLFVLLLKLILKLIELLLKLLHLKN